jgi:hypothetical protein
MHPVANGTWVCVPKTRARENHIEREEGKKEGMKHKGKRRKERTCPPTRVPPPLDAYSELDMDDDVPGVLGDVLTGGVLGDDALAFHTRVPSPLNADGGVDVDAYGNIDREPLCLGIRMAVDGEFAGDEEDEAARNVDAGEKLDFAGTRRPEIIRFRGVVGGGAEALVVRLLLPLVLEDGLEALAVRAEGTPLGGRRCERGGGSGAGILALCSMPLASSCVPSPNQVQTQVKGSRSRVALTLGGEYESNQERGQRIRSYKSAA